ncbi:hypothetical protein HMI54_008660 [Coelomomyces lativittatus]|nr:hypothetical protein HMI54_008660 [Coelomomyces lativittatus]
MHSEEQEEASLDQSLSQTTSIPYSPLLNSTELNGVSAESLRRRSSTFNQKKALLLKKMIMISGFSSIATLSGRYSLPSSKTLAILKESVLFLIPLTTSQHTNLTPIKKMLKADHIALHPDKNTLATYSKDPEPIFQVFDIDHKCRIAKVDLDATPLFFRFMLLDPHQLILITQLSFSLVTLPRREDIISNAEAIKNQPLPLFSIFDEIKSVKSIVRVDLDNEMEPQWILLVTGDPFYNNTPEKPPIYLHQLFSLKKNASQPVQAEHVCLQSTEKGLFLYLVTGTSSGKLMTIVPIRDTPTDESAIKMMRFPLDVQPDDVVLHLHVLKKSGQFFVFTQKGWVLFYHEFECEYKELMFQPGVYVMATLPSSSSDSQIILLDSSGMIFKLVYSTPIHVVPAQPSPQHQNQPQPHLFTQTTPPNSSILTNFSPVISVTQTQGFDFQLLCTLIEARRPEEAARQAAQMIQFQWSPIQEFLEKETTSTKNDLTISFLVALGQYRPLDTVESLALGMAALELRMLPSLAPLLETQRLTYSDALGDLLSIFNQLIPYALEAYKLAKSYKKAIDLMADQSMFHDLVVYVQETQYPAKDLILLSRMVTQSTPDTCQTYATLVANTYAQDPRAAEWIQKIADLLLKLPSHKEAIAFLKKFLCDEPDFTFLQNNFLSLLIQSEPESVPEALKTYSYYNPEDIATLCIEHGLYESAVMVINNENCETMYTKLWHHLFETKSLVPAFSALVHHLEKMVRLLCNVDSTLWKSFIKVSEDVEATLNAFILHERLDLVIVVLRSLFKSPYKSSQSLSTLYLLVVMLTGTSEDISKVLVDPNLSYHPQSIAKYLINLGHFEEAYFVLFQNQLYKEAAMVLVHELRDMDRAFELANWLDNPEIWQVLGKGLADYLHQSSRFKELFNYMYQNPNMKLP